MFTPKLPQLTAVSHRSTNLIQHWKIPTFGLLCVTLSIATSAMGAQWFIPCESVAHNYPKTHEVLTRGDSCFGDICTDFWRKGRCFMVNRHELIYEDEETGTNLQGLYYVNLDRPGSEPERLTSSVQSIREFVAARALRFAVIRGASMNNGYYGTSISVLQRRSDNAKAFQIQSVIGLSNNEGCASRKSENGCGELVYELELTDSSRRKYVVRSSKSPVLIPGPGSVYQRRGTTIFALPMEVTGEKKTLLLRYRLQKKPTGVFLENWDEALRTLENVASTMANPAVNTDAAR